MISHCLDCGLERSRREGDKMADYTHHPDNDQILRPYAFGFKPIGDLTFISEQNTRVINGQLDRIGTALGNSNLHQEVRTSVMKDLHALNGSLKLAAGAENMSVGVIGDALLKIDLSQEHLDSIIGF